MHMRRQCNTEAKQTIDQAKELTLKRPEPIKLAPSEDNIGGLAKDNSKQKKPESETQMVVVVPGDMGD